MRMSRATRKLTAVGVAGAAAAGSLLMATPALAATAYPTSLGESVPSVVTYGAAANVRGHLSLQGTPFALSGENVSLYARPTGSTTWTKVATHSTDIHGNVAFLIKPVRAEQYQLRHAKDSYTAASTSQTLTSKVAWRVQVTLSKAKVAPKATDSIAATVAPGAKGAVVTLQRKGSSGWVNVTSRTLNSSSATSFAFAAPATAGKYSYRVVKPASSAYVAGASATVVVTVS